MKRRTFIQTLPASSLIGISGCSLLDSTISYQIWLNNHRDTEQTVTVRVSVDNEVIFDEQLTVEIDSGPQIASPEEPGEYEIVVETATDRHTESLSLPLDDRYESTSVTNINLQDEDVEFRSWVLD